MIRLRDASLLAFTKLRTRRVRTIITIVISGLLFAILLAALVVAQGISSSVQSFNQEGLNNRYIVRAGVDPRMNASDESFLHDPAVLRRATQIYDQTIADKSAAAKRLNINYDPKSEILPIRELGGTPGQSPRTILNFFQSPSAQQALQEYLKAHPGPGLTELKAAANPYNPTGFYSAIIADPDGTVATMPGGSESFTATYGSGQQGRTDMFQTGQLTELDSHLTTPYLLAGQGKASNPTAIPLVIPYSQAEQLLNLPVLPKNASAEQHLNRIKQLYVESAKITISACYRNSISTGQISLAISQAADAIERAGDKTYQKPTLVYGLPATDSCAPATILSDTRSTGEKNQATKQQQFDTAFSTKPLTALQQKLTFRIAGLYPDVSESNNTTLGNLLQKVVGSSLGNVIAIPSDLLDHMPNAAAVRALLFPSSDNNFGMPLQSYFVEFTRASDAARFIDEKGCTTRSDGVCATATRQFQLSVYGSNSVALGDAQQKFTHIFMIATLVVTAIAIIIMSTTIGRMITDGRRETAVFRAIGAKRLDVVAIYGVYTICLSLAVALFALGAGLGIALAIDNRFWHETTIQAQLLFGASDATREFHFFALNLPAIGVIMLVAVGAGIVSMIWPIIRNVRRNPIKDMREE